MAQQLTGCSEEWVQGRNRGREGSQAAQGLEPLEGACGLSQCPLQLPGWFPWWWESAGLAGEDGAQEGRGQHRTPPPEQADGGGRTAGGGGGFGAGE